MNWWKVGGGVAAGVGTVVALPVAGPIGTVSLLGALLGGTLGGVAGAVVSEMEDEECGSHAESGRSSHNSTMDGELADTAQRLQNALKELSVEAIVTRSQAVACYEIRFALGTSCGEIDKLADDIALKIGGDKIHIHAPSADENFCMVEVPLRGSADETV